VVSLPPQDGAFCKNDQFLECGATAIQIVPGLPLSEPPAVIRVGRDGQKELLEHSRAFDPRANIATIPYKDDDRRRGSAAGRVMPFHEWLAKGAVDDTHI
jgi:hypothetical protein